MKNTWPRPRTYCAACGSTSNASGKFCGNCGSALNDVPVSAPAQLEGRYDLPARPAGADQVAPPVADGIVSVSTPQGANREARKAVQDLAGLWLGNRDRMVTTALPRIADSLTPGAELEAFTICESEEDAREVILALGAEELWWGDLDGQATWRLDLDCISELVTSENGRLTIDVNTNDTHLRRFSGVDNRLFAESVAEALEGNATIDWFGEPYEVPSQPGEIAPPVVDATGAATCPWCAEQIQIRAKRCPHCHAALHPDAIPDHMIPTSSGTNGFALAGLVCGLLGGWGLALIFGYIARSQIARTRNRQGGSGLALAAIVLGWLGALATVLLIYSIV
jgi:Domain of unknown function (DUF4190)